MIITTAVEQWVDARVARREINNLTASSYQRALHSFADHVGLREVREITAEDFESWLASQNVAGSTLNTRAAPIRAFFSWCALRGHLVADPTITVPRAKTSKPFPRRLPPDTIRKLLIVADFRTTVVLLLGLHLGLRCIEMSRLRIEHWDRENNTIDIHGKGDKWRTLYVVGEMEEVLGLWLSHLRHTRGPVFESQHAPGDPIGANTVSSIVTHAAKDAGVSATAHRLRHTFAWNLVEAGVRLPVVKALLGHESLATTTIYTQPGDDDLRQQMALLSYLN